MISLMEEPKTCPECGSTNVVYNENKEELICKDCGNIQTGVVKE